MTEPNGAIKIEKGIPIPLRGERATYPLREMTIGDSFVVESTAKRASAWNIAKRLGIRLISKELPGGKYRIWRVG